MNASHNTLLPQCKEPLYNEVSAIMNNAHQPGQSYYKCRDIGEALPKDAPATSQEDG